MPKTLIKGLGKLSLVFIFFAIQLHLQAKGKYSPLNNSNITGKVRDEKGDGLSGVSITLKGTSVGTTTDATGSYSLSVPSAEGTLVVSFVGYETVEQEIKNQTVLNFTLVQARKALDEVIMVGYGTQKKSDLTGSVGRVKSSQIMERPAINIEQALAGRVAGVNVATNSGRPGGRTTVRIRGFNSIQASNDPLYVVDGVIWTAGISTINPNDIETLDVLKDASATAIYGTRGSNGVIMITTKKGRKGGQLNYNNFVSVNQLVRKQHVLNSRQFLDIEETAYLNARKYDSVGFANGKYEDPIKKRKRYLVGNTLGNRELFTLDANGIPQPIYDVDWQDEATRTSISQSHNLSFTGSDEKSSYGFFLGYNDEQGIVKDSYLKRYTARATLERQAASWLKLGGNISYSVNQERRVDTKTGFNDVLRQMIEMVTFIPYKYPDGTYGYRGDYQGLEAGDNPVAQIYEDHNLFNTNVFSGNAFAGINILKGLDFTSTFGANVTNINNPYFNSRNSDIVADNRATVTNSQSTFLQWSNRLNYTKTFSPNHIANFLLGTEIQKYNFYQSAISTDKISDDYLMWYNLGAGASPQPPTSSYNAYQMESYFARANYTLFNKFLFTGTGRFDGSSRFGANNRFAFFPSAAVAWKVSQERFMDRLPFLSDVKLRASYGLTGNSEIGSFLSQANLSSTAVAFSNTRASATVISNLANPLLQWEKTGQYDVGIDVGLLHNRITIEADVYLKKTKNLLLAAPVPTSTGYSSLTRNIGSMENRGIELSVNTVNVQHKDFSWLSSLNFSTLKNKITALGAKNEDIIFSPNATNILRVGSSVSSFYGYVREGTWSTSEVKEAATFNQKPGDLKMKDLNNDGIFNASDRTIIGKGIPDFYGTFSNTVRYKNLDLVIELQYSYGNQILQQTIGTAENRQGLANSYTTVLDAWTPEHQNTDIAQYRPVGAGYLSVIDSHRVVDGSFIRGKNLSLGYSLKPQTISAIGATSLRFYISAQNLFLITPYTGYDPEVTSYGDAFAQGIVFHDYPKPRVLMVGVNVNF